MQSAICLRENVGKNCQSAKAERWLTTRLPAVIAQMFEWNWDSVAAECTSFLGPAGYGYVQGEYWGSIDVLMLRVLTIIQ